MFKIGDFVVNKKEYSGGYSITNCKNNYIGKVISVGSRGIEVETIRATWGIVGDIFLVDPKHFTLYKDNRTTIQKLKESKKNITSFALPRFRF